MENIQLIFPYTYDWDKYDEFTAGPPNIGHFRIKP
ncbi:hypothetical protein DFP94_12040 [Fontibacillus phaseoli]|uniref:Uncharacterized protein n=1 Tax=Fontibacillus phaseoli TaxID=1416533 RepID=A0A369AWT8_9BACL|nr:hypothetical protein DFP94_12040 [Fontibacillus phaseoli]